jgi:hypothetical protein
MGRSLSGEFERSLGYLGGVASMFVEVFQALEKYGYYGLSSEEGLAWSKEQVSGKLTLMAEYFEAHPLKLE